jgi:hypothetical protein
LTESVETPVGILICLTSLEDDLADHSALQLAKLFGSHCRALVIEDQTAARVEQSRVTGEQLISRRQRRLTILGQEMGLDVEVDMSELSPGIERLQAQPDNVTTILMQPVHPLSRQTHLFRSLQSAVAAAAASTVYSPPSRNLDVGDLLVLTSARDGAGIAIAKKLAQSRKRAYEVFPIAATPQPTVSSLVRALTLRMSLDAPSLIVMTQDELLSKPSDFSSLAARLDTPVLVVGGFQTATRPAA